MHDENLEPVGGSSCLACYEDSKTMLSDEEPKPCKPISMKNVESIIEGILTFIQCWESLRVVNVGDHFTIDMELE